MTNRWDVAATTWRNMGGAWKPAAHDRTCDGCGQTIPKGAMYLATGPAGKLAGTYRTASLCDSCAVEPSATPADDDPFLGLDGGPM